MSVEELLSRYVQHHVMHGERLRPEDLCADAPGLVEPLREAIARYEELDRAMDAPDDKTDAPTAELPSFEGFRTVERIGHGGMGEVYKLEDLTLGRTVAAKVLRGTIDASFEDFLREASTLALFGDRRIVQIHEFRPDLPAIIMEYVDGFELGEVSSSLEFAQRARVVEQLCDAIDRAHGLGIQHRDLKPSNVMLDARLEPRILDFGLSRGDPEKGHGVGTLPYLSPEQLDVGQPIDARADVYALGVIFYELLCGETPFRAGTDEQVIGAIREGRPLLPVEVHPQVPEPLQAIALKAMERDPADRYTTAREMARELRNWLEGRPVLARPTLYASALERRLLPHLQQVDDWLAHKLIYPHEAKRLREEYHRLSSREDDWIVESRRLSYAQIALYLGAFVLGCGGVLYFGAHRFHDAASGTIGPLTVLGLPFVGLNAAAHMLYRRGHQAVGVAFATAGVLLLPLLLLILMAEIGLWVVPAQTPGQLFDEISNRQLQFASLAAAAWSGLLAWRTRTSALSSVYTALIAVLWLALLCDRGLDRWLTEGRWDLLGVHLLLLAPLLGGAGRVAERRGLPWASKPLVLGCAVLTVLSLELLAVDGKALGYLGITLAGLQDPGVAHPLLLDTLAAMTVVGLLVYAAGNLMERYGGAPTRPTTWLLLTLSPFAICEPLAWLCGAGDYAAGFDWLYLGLSLAITFLSYRQQRRSFYFGGLLNTGVALYLITHHQQWFDDAWWPAAVVLAGLAVLGAGLGFDYYDRVLRRRRGA